MEKKLTIELVPRGTWDNNVRSNVTREKWDQIRYTSYRLAGHRCEICGEKGKEQGYDRDVECHEIWDYDEGNGIQKLTGFISLCPQCHKVKHFGLAELKGEYGMVCKQLMKVNDMSVIEVEEYVKEEKWIWQRRNNLAWVVDISYIDKFLNDNDPITAFMSKY